MAEEADSNLLTRQPSVEELTKESTCCSGLRCSFSLYTKGTLFSSIFTLLTTSIGAGTLALPYAFSQGGLVYAGLMLLLVMLISIVSGLFLFSSKRYASELFPTVDILGYEDLAELTFGVAGRMLVLITLVVFLFLALIAYMIYARDQLDYVVQFIIMKTGHFPNCSIFSNCALLMVLAFFPIFPLTLLRNITPFQITSTISIVCIVFVAVLMSVQVGDFYNGENGTSILDVSVTLLSEAGNGEDIGLFPESIRAALTCVSYCSLCFVCHFQVFTLEKELERPTPARLDFIIVASMLIAYAIYNVVALSGYLLFLGNTSEDIMTNYPSSDHLMTAARVALFFTLLFCYPVLLHPTRSAVNRLTFFLLEMCKKGRATFKQRDVEESGEAELLISSRCYQHSINSWKNERRMFQRTTSVRNPNWLVWFCETWVIFGASLIPAAVIPNVGYVWNFVGSIGGTLILYIFPALFYLRLRYLYRIREAVKEVTSLSHQYCCRRGLWKDCLAGLIAILGLFLLVVENYVSVKDVIGGSKGQPSLCVQHLCIENSSAV